MATMAREKIEMRIEPMPGQTVVAAAHQHIGGALASPFVVVVVFVVDVVDVVVVIVVVVLVAVIFVVVGDCGGGG